jgi:hypothetical protein
MKSTDLHDGVVKLIFLTTLATFAFAELTLRAGIIGVATPNVGGTHTYSYEVDNRLGTFPVVDWSLDLAVTPDWNPDDLAVGGDVQVPSGWGASAGIPITGIAAQDFFSFLSDVPPGASLSGFAFTSALPPGSVKYFEFGPSGESTTGMTVGPTPVPDGGAWWGVNLVLCVALVLCRRPQFM